MELSIISYNQSSALMEELHSAEDIVRYQNERDIAWINVNGFANAVFIKELAALYKIHPLTIEDITHTGQQPKIEVFDHYRFLSVKTIQKEKKFRYEEKPRFFKTRWTKNQADENNEILIDQISIIIMENTVITFQEISGDSFDPIRRAILENTGRIRKAGTGFLVYSILDAVVDEYFLRLEHLEDDIEDFEERAVKTSDDEFITELQETKKYLLQIKRAIVPLRDNLVVVSHQTNVFFGDEIAPFLQDLRENTNNALDTVEHYREWLSNIMEVNISVLSQQMNKVMKMLALISTVFIPLTFIAGVYGMNFQFMPELVHPLGYPIVLMFMALVAGVMFVFFKMRHWF